MLPLVDEAVAVVSALGCPLFYDNSYLSELLIMYGVTVLPELRPPFYYNFDSCYF